jgi:hypothetical protein
LATPALKSLVVLAALVSALAFGTTHAAAATPCWRTLINDWYDGRIDNTYPVHCYTEALKYVPTEYGAYSSVRDDIKRALALAVRRNGGGPLNPNATIPPSTNPSNGTGKGAGPGATGTRTIGRHTQKGWLYRVVDALGPGNADSVPLPLLVLGSVALLLLLAALGSVLAKRVQARRLEPAPAPANPPKRP